MNTCPVCGYAGLRRPAEDFIICPSCGTEFGYHDTAVTHDQLRALWLRRGAVWSSSVVPEPVGWNAHPPTVRVETHAKLARQIINGALRG